MSAPPVNGLPGCAGSPCARCPRERPGRACMSYLRETDQRVNGCGKWYSWYTAAWQNIRRQGMEAIGRKAGQSAENTEKSAENAEKKSDNAEQDAERGKQSAKNRATKGEKDRDETGEQNGKEDRGTAAG